MLSARRCGGEPLGLLSWSTLERAPTDMPDIIDSPPALQAVPTYRVHPARAKAAFEVWQALQFTERAKPYLRENEAWKLAKQDCFNRFLFEFEAL